MSLNTEVISFFTKQHVMNQLSQQMEAYIQLLDLDILTGNTPNVQRQSFNTRLVMKQLFNTASANMGIGLNLSLFMVLRSFNHQSIQATICEVAPNHLKIIARHRVLEHEKYKPNIA